VLHSLIEQNSYKVQNALDTFSRIRLGLSGLGLGLGHGSLASALASRSLASLTSLVDGEVANLWTSSSSSFIWEHKRLQVAQLVTNLLRICYGEATCGTGIMDFGLQQTPNAEVTEHLQCIILITTT